jgi:regulator of protease activity HflC (stomatin/prohibitin superfamily)
MIKVAVVVCLIVFFVSTAFIRFSTLTVPENKRVIIMRFGKILGSRGPGLVTLIPLIDFAIWVDLQPTFHYKFDNLPMSDNHKISFSVSLEGYVMDPEKCVLNVPNLEDALSNVIGTELTVIAKSKSSDELRQKNEWLASQLKDVLYRISRSWGFEVNKLSIHEI